VWWRWKSTCLADGSWMLEKLASCAFVADREAGGGGGGGECKSTSWMDARSGLLRRQREASRYIERPNLPPGTYRVAPGKRSDKEHVSSML
jgi:hypothetical protein